MTDKAIETAMILGYKIAMSRCGIPQSEIESYAIDLGLSESDVKSILGIKEDC